MILNQFSATTTYTFSCFQLCELSEVDILHSNALKMLFDILLKNIARGLGNSMSFSWESALYPDSGLSPGDFLFVRPFWLCCRSS